MNRQQRKMPSHSQTFHYWRFQKLAPPNKHTCFRCGWECDKQYNLERAHIVARCDGGPDAVENLVLVCHDCHVETDGWSRKKWVDYRETMRAKA